MSPQGGRTGNLALVFQELLTVGERLRSNRQAVTDAASFRGADLGSGEAGGSGGAHVRVRGGRCGTGHVRGHRVSG